MGIYIGCARLNGVLLVSDMVCNEIINLTLEADREAVYLLLVPSANLGRCI